MAQPEHAIHVGYAYSSKFKEYRARAYVGLPLQPWHSITVALGDTAAEAVEGAIEYIRQIHARDNIPMPKHVIYRGRLAAIVVDNLAF